VAVSNHKWPAIVEDQAIVAHPDHGLLALVLFARTALSAVHGVNSIALVVKRSIYVSIISSGLHEVQSFRGSIEAATIAPPTTKTRT